MYFIEGEYHEQYCPWCQQLHPGRLFLNRFYWCCIFDKHCGREKVLGYTMPTDELVQLGLASGNAPAVDPKTQVIRDVEYNEEQLAAKWAIDNLNSGRTRSKFL